MSWHFVLMAFMYIVAGAMHFIKPRIYIKVMPDYFKYKAFLVFLSGVVEVLLGLALFFDQLKDFAIYGLVLMLLVFLTVHINMLKGEQEAQGLPKFIVILRLPLQFLLIAWALYYL